MENKTWGVPKNALIMEPPPWEAIKTFTTRFKDGKWQVKINDSDRWVEVTIKGNALKFTDIPNAWISK